MNTKTTIVPSSTLWEILHDAGLAPDQCLDIVIEAPLGGLVKIHYSMYPGYTLAKVIAAFAQKAQVVESVRAIETTDQSDTAQSYTGI